MTIRPIKWLLLVCLAGIGTVCAATPEERYTAQRQRMVREIAAEMRQTPTLMGKSSLDPRVMQALDTVPRHAFVPPHLQPHAYANRPLAIGYGQTISQPYIVAVMTNLLQLDKDEVVLEIGTGSGYQAAVLATLARQVYSIEIIKELAEPAQERLQRLGYTNVEVRRSDGYAGWEAHAPFDAIMVTAAASHIPPPLLQQLKPGGRMLIPVGSPFQTQQLLLVTKDSAGQVTTRYVLPVAFVPLLGQH